MRHLTYTCKSLTLCAAIGLTLTAAHAGEKYSCTFKDRVVHEPIAETMELDVRPGDWFAFVEDEYTRQISGSSVKATVDAYSPRKLRLKWQLVGLTHRGRDKVLTGDTVDYKLTVNLQSGVATLTGATRQFASRVYAQGTCVRR